MLNKIFHKYMGWGEQEYLLAIWPGKKNKNQNSDSQKKNNINLTDITHIVVLILGIIAFINLIFNWDKVVTKPEYLTITVTLITYITARSGKS